MKEFKKQIALILTLAMVFTIIVPNLAGAEPGDGLTDPGLDEELFIPGLGFFDPDSLLLPGGDGIDPIDPFDPDDPGDPISDGSVSAFSDFMALSDPGLELYISSTGNSTNNGLSPATPRTLTSAIAIASTTSLTTIYVMDDILAFGDQLSAFNGIGVENYVAADKDIVIKSLDPATRVNRISNNNGNGSLIVVNGGKVTFEDIILTMTSQVKASPSLWGNCDNPLLVVRTGELTLGSGTVVRDNMNIGSRIEAVAGWGPGIVYSGAFENTGTGGIINMLEGSSVESNTMTGDVTAAVFLNGTSAVFNMYGGTITNNTNTSSNGSGGVYVQNGTFNMGGDPIDITGNTAAGVASNVYLRTGQTINLTTPLHEDTEVGVFAQTMPTTVGAKTNIAVGSGRTATLADSEKFSSDRATGAGIIFDTDDIIKLSYDARSGGPALYVHATEGNNTNAGTREAPLATIEQAFRNMNTRNMPNATIVLLSNVNYTSSDAINSLMGNNRTATIRSDVEGERFTVFMSQPPTPTNSMLHVPDGSNTHLRLQNVIFDWSRRGATTSSWGDLFIGSTCSITLGDGAALHGRAGVNRAVNIRASGTFVMLPGSLITGFTAGTNPGYGGYTGTANAGAAVYVCPYGTFEMHGGRIHGNEASAGAAGVFGEANATFRMSGAPVVYDNFNSGLQSNVYLRTGQTITRTGPITAAAKVGVYVQAMPTSTTPAATPGRVPIVTGAAAGESAGFLSDKASSAGISYGTPVATTIYIDFNSRGDGSGSHYVHPTRAGTNTPDGSFEIPYRTIQDAYNNISLSLPNAEIRVLSDLTMTSAVTTFGTASRNVVIRSYSSTIEGVPLSAANAWIIRRGVTGSGNLFALSNGNVGFRDIIIDGQGGVLTTAEAAEKGLRGGGGTLTSTGALFAVTGGELTLYEGAVTQNNITNSGTNNSAGISVSGSGSLVMENDSSVRYNRRVGSNAASPAVTGGGVSVIGVHPGPESSLSKFTMNGGTIENNTASGNSVGSGGGLMFWANRTGSIIISGGLIRNNTGQAGGGIVLDSDARLTMTGGTITGNTATGAPTGLNPLTAVGGGIGVYYSGTFIPTFTVGAGSVINITGNKNSLGQESNVYLFGSSATDLLSLTTNATIVISSVPTAGSRVGVYVPNMPTVTYPKRVIATGASGLASTWEAIFSSDRDTEAGISFGVPVATQVYLDYDKRIRPIPGIDAATGKGVIDILRMPNTVYTLKGPAPDTAEVGNALGGTAGGPYRFDDLIPGGTYTLETGTAPDIITTVLTIPSVGNNASANLAGDKITISPADPRASYALVDASGNLIGAWESGSPIEFTVTPGTTYHIIAAPTGLEPVEIIGLHTHPSAVEVRTSATTRPTTATPTSLDRSRDGKTISISPTLTTQEYAIIDPETGEVVGEWKAGVGASPAVTFGPLDPDKVYEIVTRERGTPPTVPPTLPIRPGATILPGLPATDPLPSGPSVTGNVDSITIDPTSDDTWYAVVDEDGNIVGGNPGGWEKGTGGPITIDGLDPGKKYKVVTFPEDPARPTTPPAVSEPVGGGTSIITAPAPAGPVTRLEDDANEGYDVMSFPTDPGYEYAVVLKGTDPNNAVWFTGGAAGSGSTGVSGGQLPYNIAGPAPFTATVTSLNHTREYEVLKRVLNTDPNVIAVPNKTTVPRLLEITGEFDPATEKVSITISPTEAGKSYIIVDEDGMPAGNPDTWRDGAPGSLTVTGLDPNKKYKVLVFDPDADGGGNILPAGPGPFTGTEPGVKETEFVTPVAPVSKDDIKTKIEDDNTATIIIDPALTGQQYAVRDPETGLLVDGGWKPGEDGALEFKGLTPGKIYEVLTVPEPLPSSYIVCDPTPVYTPFGDVSSEYDPVTNKSTLSISPTDSGRIYAVVDEDGNIVTGITPVSTDGWVPGTGGELTFGGLDPGKGYKVISLPVTATAEDKRDIIDPDKGILDIVDTLRTSDGSFGLKGTVKNDSGVGIPGVPVTVVVDTPAGPRTLTAITKSDGSYEIVSPKGVTVYPGDYTVYVDCKAAGVEYLPIKYTGVHAEDMDIIVIPDKYGTNSVSAGIITDNGVGIPGVTVVVRDKQTGELISPPPEIVPSSDAGGYVILGLDPGTYIVEIEGVVDGIDVSGMTEIVVGADGAVSPNRAGGFRSQNIGASRGQIVSGTVEGLAPGEKATVTITVPVWDEGLVPPAIVGTRILTAIAEGPGGYYQFAGVSPGDYPVTATKDNGDAITRTVTVGAVRVEDVNFDFSVDTGGTGNFDEFAPKVLTGVVVDHDGLPLAGATVRLYDSQGNPVPGVTATTGAGGGYSLVLPEGLTGDFYISADHGGVSGNNGLSQVRIKDGVLDIGKTAITIDKSPGTPPGKMLTGTVVTENTEGDEIPVAGATVVVRDPDGKILATTTTNSEGQYFVENVPMGAIVSVLTKDGEVGSATTSGAANPYRNNITAAKPGPNLLTVIGPDGAQLRLNNEDNDMPGVGSNNASTAKVTITLKDDPFTDVTAKALGSDGVLNVEDLPAGTYVITIEQNGMLVEREITVANPGGEDSGEGTIVGSNVITIPPRTITGKVDYEAGTIPSDATVTIKGGEPTPFIWGEAKVDPRTGEYSISGIPEGDYEIELFVKDPEDPTKNVKLTAKMSVDPNGVVTYEPFGTPVPPNGADVEVTGNNFKVTPPTDVLTVIAELADAFAFTDLLDALVVETLKAALDDFDALTDEQKLQVPASLVDAVSVRLTAILETMDLTITAEAEGMQNVAQVIAALKKQAMLLLTREDIDNALDIDTSVDIELALIAEDVSDNPPNMADVNKIDAVATAKGALIAAIFNITVTKTTTVTDDGNELPPVLEVIEVIPQKITLTLEIPAEFAGYDYYAIVHVHKNGAATPIPSTVSIFGGKTYITFETNKFSTFAILYSDNPIFGDEEVVVRQDQVPPGGVGGGRRPGGEEEPEDIEDESDVSALLNTVDHNAYVQGIGNRLFAPDAGITRAEVAQMFYNLLLNKNVAVTIRFPDVPQTAWYARAVETLTTMGIIKGFDDGTFRPNATITRAELAAIMVRFATLSPGDPRFIDVPESHWAADYINTAAKFTWIYGVGGNRFAPTQGASRAEAVTMINRMLKRFPDKEFIDSNVALITFTDVTRSHWAFYDIMEAANTHDYEKNETNTGEFWKP